MASNRYWEHEEPETVTTDHYLFSVYKEAGMLQMGRLVPGDTERTAKAIGMHIDELRANPKIKELLISALTAESK